MTAAASTRRRWRRVRVVNAKRAAWSVALALTIATLHTYQWTRAVTTRAVAAMVREDAQLLLEKLVVGLRGVRAGLFLASAYGTQVERISEDQTPYVCTSKKDVGDFFGVTKSGKTSVCGCIEHRGVFVLLAMNPDGDCTGDHVRLLFAKAP